MESKPGNTVAKLFVKEWQLSGIGISGNMEDGRGFRINIAGFDKAEADRIAAHLADVWPEVVKTALQ